MPRSIGGRWLRELAERCAMGAEAAISGGGPPAIERVQNDIKAAAAAHRLEYADVVRAVALIWERQGVIPWGSALKVAGKMAAAAR